MDQQEEEMTIATVMETSGKYGKDFILVTILLGAMGTGFMTVWNWVQADMKEQDARIAESDSFIRDKLVGALAETQNLARECKTAIEDNSDSNDSIAKAIERNSDVLSRVNAQMSAYPPRPHATPLN